MVHEPLLAVLHTPRLVLEPLVAAHADLLWPGFSDPALYAHVPGDPPEDLEALRARFRRLEERRSPCGTERWLNWAVRLADGPAHVGLVEATVRDDLSTLIAYFVFTPFARRGLGTEAVGEMIRWLARSGVHTFEATISTRNVASWRLVERLGFVRVGLRRGAWEKDGLVDDYDYVLAL